MESSPFPAQYKIDMWGIDEGLPQNSVRAIVQTRDGFLWLGTYGGLARFDGVKFKVYNRGNTKAMLSDRILFLHEDTQGKLWIGTEGGGVMILQGDTFSVFTTKDGLADNSVSAIEQDSGGRIWFSHDNNTVSKYEHGTFNVFSFQDSVKTIYHLTISPEGKLLYVTSEKMLSYENGKFRFYQLLFPEKNLRLSFRPLWDKKGNCWVATSEAIYRFQNNNGALSSQRINVPIQSSFLSMLVDSKNNLWISTEKYFCRYDSASVTSFSHLDVISRNRLITLFEDKEKNLWFGTHTEGLIRFREKPFTVFAMDTAGAVNNVTSITSLSNGSVAYGLNCGGFGIISNGKIRSVIRFNTLDQNECTWSLFENSQKQIWNGTWGGGLLQCELNERYELVRSVKNNFVTSDVILSIYEDRQKAMWIGTQDKGLFRLKNGSVTHYTVADGLSNNEVRAILETQNGEMWIGTGSGLNKLSAGKFTVFTTNDGLSNNSIRTMYEDTSGVLWLGTYGGGLSRFENGTFTSFTTKEGLFDNLVSHILEDDFGFLWMGCNRGIFRVAKQELNEVAAGKRTTVSCISFGKDHGLVNVETNGGFQPNALKTPDGRLWFPTVAGVACVNPAEIKLNTTIIPVVIEKISVDQKEIPFHHSLSVGPEQHTIIISYTAPSFIEPKNVRFKYKLSGYDKEWIDAETRREAYYTELPGGTYTFTVLAANNDGVWNTVGASLFLTIIPPFWKTWWFVTFSVLFVGGTAFGLAHSRYVHLQKAKQERETFSHRLMEQTEEERKRISAELHDSIGQQLLIIKNMSELGIRKSKVLEEALKRFQDISSVSEVTVKQLREISHNLRPLEIDRFGVWQAIKTLSAKVEESSSLRMVLNMEEIDTTFPKETEMHIFRIVQEAMNNIIKHSNATESTITVMKRESSVIVTVTDNGKGLMEADEQGIGFSSMQARARAMNAKLSIDSKPGNGTQLTLVIPSSIKE